MTTFFNFGYSDKPVVKYKLSIWHSQKNKETQLTSISKKAKDPVPQNAGEKKKTHTQRNWSHNHDFVFTNKKNKNFSSSKLLFVLSF